VLTLTNLLTFFCSTSIFQNLISLLPEITFVFEVEFPQTEIDLNHIEGKFKKLEKWQVEFIGCQATISKEPNKQKKIEAVISVPKGQLIASAAHEDLYIAVNEVEQKLERQLNKLRHKPDARSAIHSNIPVMVEYVIVLKPFCLLLKVGVKP
jgi:ribosome-associated inhibitor A